MNPDAQQAIRHAIRIMEDEREKDNSPFTVENIIARLCQEYELEYPLTK